MEQPIKKQRGGWRGGGRPKKSPEDRYITMTITLPPLLRQRLKENTEPASRLIDRLLTEHFNNIDNETK